MVSRNTVGTRVLGIRLINLNVQKPMINYQLEQTLWQARAFYLKVICSPIDICYKDKAMKILDIMGGF